MEAFLPAPNVPSRGSEKAQRESAPDYIYHFQNIKKSKVEGYLADNKLVAGIVPVFPIIF
jgi:hypothetical protein